ncbi:hypothetical protein EJD97_003707, partial [Solanum chilense]
NFLQDFTRFCDNWHFCVVQHFKFLICQYCGTLKLIVETRGIESLNGRNINYIWISFDGKIVVEQVKLHQQ